MRHMHCANRAAVVLLVVVLTITAAAGEDTEGEEAFHPRHAIGGFVGVTRAEGESLSTFGIEYFYRFHRYWSAGAVVERADRDRDSTLLIAAVNLHPYKGWFLSGGFGRKDPRDKRENTARFAIGYEFEFAGGWAIAPNVSKDFIENEENEEVFGVTFSKLF